MGWAEPRPPAAGHLGNGEPGQTQSGGWQCPAEQPARSLWWTAGGRQGCQEAAPADLSWEGHGGWSALVPTGSADCVCWGLGSAR